MLRYNRTVCPLRHLGNASSAWLRPRCLATVPVFHQSSRFPGRSRITLSSQEVQSVGRGLAQAANGRVLERDAVMSPASVRLVIWRALSGQRKTLKKIGPNTSKCSTLKEGRNSSQGATKKRQQPLNMQPVCVGLVGKATLLSHLDGFIEYWPSCCV